MPFNYLKEPMVNGGFLVWQIHVRRKVVKSRRKSAANSSNDETNTLLHFVFSCVCSLCTGSNDYHSCSSRRKSERWNKRSGIDRSRQSKSNVSGKVVERS